MNDESLDDELDLGVEKAPKPWKKIIIIVLGVLLLVGVGGGVTYLLVAPSDETSKGEETQVAEEEGEGEEPKGPAIYKEFRPVFVVNLSPEGKKKAKMLQDREQQ